MAGGAENSLPKMVCCYPRPHTLYLLFVVFVRLMLIRWKMIYRQVDCRDTRTGEEVGRHRDGSGRIQKGGLLEVCQGDVAVAAGGSEDGGPACGRPLVSELGLGFFLHVNRLLSHEAKVQSPWKSVRDRHGVGLWPYQRLWRKVK